MSRIKELTGLNNIDVTISLEEFVGKVSHIVIVNKQDNRSHTALGSFHTEGGAFTQNVS